MSDGNDVVMDALGADSGPGRTLQGGGPPSVRGGVMRQPDKAVVTTVITRLGRNTLPVIIIS